MKKIYLGFLILVLTVLAACGAQPVSDEPAELPVEETAETQTVDEAKAETIAQRIERLDIRDVQADIVMEVETLSEQLNMNIKSNSQLAYSAINHGLYAIVDTVINDNADNVSQLEAYADEEYIYLRTNQDPTWRKHTTANQTIDPESLIKTYTVTEFRPFYEAWKDQLVIEETDTEYKITLEGSGNELVDYIRQTMNSIQGLRIDESMLDIYLVKDVRVVHTFDKATNLPTTQTIFLNYMFRGQSVNIEHILDVKIDYTAVNEGFVLAFPAEFESLELEADSL